MPAPPLESADVPRARVAAAVSIGIAALVLSAGCASGRFVPPTVAPGPFPEAAEAWAEATRECVAMSSYRAEVRVAGRRFGPTVTLAVALDAQGHVALDARVEGSSMFTLRGSEAQATLVIPERRQFVTAPPDEILDALIGVSVGPRRLLAILAGCVSVTREVERAERFGRVARVAATDADVYLTRVRERWRVRAATFDEVSVDYGALGADGPGRITLSAAGANGRTELTLVVVAFDTTRVRPEQFLATVPSSATPLSLQELRTDGPLARREN